MKWKDWKKGKDECKKRRENGERVVSDWEESSSREGVYIEERREWKKRWSER